MQWVNHSQWCDSNKIFYVDNQRLTGLFVKKVKKSVLLKEN